MKKYIIGFKMHNEFKWLSHLEIIRIFERLFRKYDIGLDFSKGFNPHPKIKIAVPKSLGVESDSEYIEAICTDSENNIKRLIDETQHELNIFDISVDEEQSSKVTKRVEFVIYNFYDIIIDEDIDFSSIRGYIEHKIDNKILTIKTMSDFSFSKFSKLLDFKKVIREVKLK